MQSTKSYLALITSNSTIGGVIPPHILNPALDFLASSLSTFLCSVVSTPQVKRLFAMLLLLLHDENELGLSVLLSKSKQNVIFNPIPLM